MSEPTRVRRRWYAVRCCCSPTKLFGFLPLEKASPVQDIRDRSGAVHKIEVMRVSKHRCRLPAVYDGAIIPDPGDALFIDDELAIHSDDRPIEFWRTIPGFVETANQEEE